MGNPWKVITAFLGVFIAGAVFGGFFSLGVAERLQPGHHRAPPPIAPGAEPSPGAPRPPTHPMPMSQKPLLAVPPMWQSPQLMRRYAERLDLTPEQKQRIDPLLQRAIEDYRRLQQNTFRETGIILHRLQQDIAKELTPAQRQELEKMEQRQRETLQKLERQREQKKAGGAQRPNSFRPSRRPPGDDGAARSAEPATMAPAGVDAATPAAPSATTPPTAGEKQE